MSKKKNNKEYNQQIIVRWVIPVLILIVVLVVLVSKFGVESETNARTSVNRKLNKETETYAKSIYSVLKQVSTGGQGAASIIDVSGLSASDSWKDYAHSICNNVPGTYLVALVDTTGTGVASDGTSVKLFNEPYFSISGNVIQTHTMDDGIKGKEAFVTIVPMTIKGQRKGSIVLYAGLDSVERDLPTKEYGGHPTYAIISSDGTIVSASGSDSYFTNGDNFLANLSASNMSELTMSQVEVRVTRMTPMVFSAVKGDENKTISVAPIGIGEWQLVCIMNQSYVSTEIKSEMDNPRNLLISLTVTLGAFVVLLLTLSLTTKIKSKEESKELADKADTDLLTEVNNKIATERKIQEYMDENPDSQCLMFMFDIDNFKKINDTMGHAFGDEVLSTLGHQLRNEFRVSDIIGRLGGDEFVLFLKNIKSDEQLERESIRITNFFHQFKAGSYVQYSATASIGAAIFPGDAGNFHDLYNCADKALYEAKRRGKNQLVFYSKELADVESIRVTDDIDSNEKK